MGFTFDDAEGTTPISEMHRLLQANPRNAERIAPFLGGDEINSDPIHAHRRYVISFGDFPLKRDPALDPWTTASANRRRAFLQEGVVPADYPDPVAADWPELLQIITERVKPERDRLRGNPDAERRRKFFWHWGRSTPSLDSAKSSLIRTLVHSYVSQYLAFTFVPAKCVVAGPQNVFVFEDQASFAVLQNRVHEVWVRFFAAAA
jgi:hypothetical protein